MLKKDRIIELFAAGWKLEDIAAEVKSKIDYVDYVIKVQRPANKPRYVSANHPGIRIHIDWDYSLNRKDVIRDYER